MYTYNYFRFSKQTALTTAPGPPTYFNHCTWLKLPAWKAGDRGFEPHCGLQVSKKPKCFFPAHSLIINIVGNLSDREVACSASDRQASYFESCVWRAVSSHSCYHSQEVFLDQALKKVLFIVGARFGFAIKIKFGLLSLLLIDMES